MYSHLYGFAILNAKFPNTAVFLHAFLCSCSITTLVSEIAGNDQRATPKPQQKAKGKEQEYSRPVQTATKDYIHNPKDLHDVFYPDIYRYLS